VIVAAAPLEGGTGLGGAQGQFSVFRMVGAARILGLVFTLLLPRWVAPPVHAVEECDRVARRSLELPRYRAISRDSGVAAALVWLTLGEVSPLTQRFGGGIWDPPGATPDDSTATWCSSVTYEMARAESWVAVVRGRRSPAV
jgi:hypothetical protein